MLLGLLRHGETEGGACLRGQKDDPLTPAGLAQMHATMAGSECWEQVISSPLLRCAEFARIFARQYSLPLSCDPRLREIHFGQWEGCTTAELMEQDREALTRFWRDPDTYPPPDGETLVCFQARVLQAWNDILTTQMARQTLIVTHGGVIRILLCHIREMPISQWHEFDIPYGKLHQVRIDGNGLTKLMQTDFK